ncbi:hypothetical protein [Pseudomonas sp. PDM27]|uniref:hypothetical protein n=1 Tax=Pseudomonas sp. PDM27 TaxID=2854769 RepID=UPI001C45970B|nr:hypothetical protein [Pseudomonas sp. PDM27]MBV7566131.1 hypothetical protein [Pseudomonas sp. PDM27]
MEKVRRSQQTISYDASLAESARATKTACLKCCTQFAVERNNMLSPSISSLNSLATSKQADTPTVAAPSSEHYFLSSFSPANGDLVLGQISVVSKGGSIWTPVRLLGSLLSMFNIVVQEPESFCFQDAECTEINDRPDSIVDLVDMMEMVLKEERQRKKSRVNNEPVRQLSSITIHNSNVDSARGAVHEKACVWNFCNGFLKAMGEVEESIEDSKVSGGSALTDYCGIFLHNKLDQLFLELCKHPRYIPVDTLLATASKQKEPLDGKPWQRIHKPAAHLFSIISKDMIDAFTRPQSKSEPTARIHFFLDDIKINDVVDGTDTDASRTTSEELRHLYQRRDELGDTVRFYQDNLAVPSPWEQDPELWSRCKISVNSAQAPSAPEKTITKNVQADSKGEMSESVSSLLTDEYYDLLRDFAGIEIARGNIGSPAEISKRYEEGEWGEFITLEEFASLLTYEEFYRYIQPCLDKFDSEKKGINTIVVYMVSALNKLRESTRSTYCDNFVVGKFFVDKFFAARKNLLDEFRKHSYLPNSVMPIKPVPDRHDQKFADLDQIFDFKRNDKDEYEFVRKSDGESCKLNGVFSYVILPEKPDHVYCGVGNGLQNSKGGGNIYRFFNPDYVEGHSSLAQGKDVLFAGEFLFEDGQLKLWTNGSGHYLPVAELRLTNLTEVVKRILPEDLFRDHDKLTETERTARNRYLRISEEDESILRDRYPALANYDSAPKTDLDVFRKLMIDRGLGYRVDVRFSDTKSAGAVGRKK